MTHTARAPCSATHGAWTAVQPAPREVHMELTAIPRSSLPRPTAAPTMVQSEVPVLPLHTYTRRRFVLQQLPLLRLLHASQRAEPSALQPTTARSAPARSSLHPAARAVPSARLASECSSRNCSTPTRSGHMFQHWNPCATHDHRISAPSAPPPLTHYHHANLLLVQMHTLRTAQAPQGRPLHAPLCDARRKVRGMRSHRQPCCLLRGLQSPGAEPLHPMLISRLCPEAPVRLAAWRVHSFPRGSLRRLQLCWALHEVRARQEDAQERHVCMRGQGAGHRQPTVSIKIATFKLKKNAQSTNTDDLKWSTPSHVPFGIQRCRPITVFLAHVHLR